MFDIPNNNWNFIDSKKIKELQEIHGKLNRYFPSDNNVLRFLETDFNNIKYVIVGMEPYPTDFMKDGTSVPVATGRSFEVATLRGKTWDEKFKQSSLRNMLKAIYYAETGINASLDTIRKEIREGRFLMKQPGEWFDSMESQGVLFLNASLTVEPYNVGSHREYWDKFVTDLIKHIDNNLDVVWLLWGKDAKDRVFPHVKNSICSCHPRLSEFVIENCFMDERVRKVDWKG